MYSVSSVRGRSLLLLNRMYFSVDTSRICVAIGVRCLSGEAGVKPSTTVSKEPVDKDFFFSQLRITENQLRSEMAQMGAQIRAEMQEGFKKVDERFEKIDRRFEKMDAKNDARFEKLMEKMDSNAASARNLSLTLASLGGTILAAGFAFMHNEHEKMEGRVFSRVERLESAVFMPRNKKRIALENGRSVVSSGAHHSLPTEKALAVD